MEKSKKIENNSIRIGKGAVFNGDTAIGKNPKIYKRVNNHKNSHESDKEERISMASLANMAIKEIEILAKNDKLSHKLAAFNLILFLVVLGINLSYWAFGWPQDNMMLVVQIAISMIFSAIITLLYSKGIKLLLDIIPQKINGFRASIPILMTALSLSLFGILFQKEILLNVSGGLLLLQGIVILILGYLHISSIPIEDKPITKLKPREWLGDFANIITIGNFIAWIIITILKLI